MNTTSIISTIICILAVYRMIKIQLYSDCPLKTFLFYVYLTFYICSIIAIPFAIAGDIIICFPSLFPAHHFTHIERIFFGFEIFFFLSSWMMFNIVLFARLYFTFKDSIYRMSKKCTILSIINLSFITLFLFPGLILYAMYDLTLVILILFTIVCLWLMIFSQILVFIFVYKLFDMNLTSLVNSLGVLKIPLEVITSVRAVMTVDTDTDVGSIEETEQQRMYRESCEKIFPGNIVDFITTSSATSTPIDIVPIPAFNPPAVSTNKDIANAIISRKRRRTRVNIDRLCSAQIQLITKYTLLAMLSVISSAIAIIACMVWMVDVNFDSLRGSILINIIGISLTSHVLLNVICVTFAFKIYEKQYGFLCSCCDRKLQICCFNLVEKHYESKSEIQKNYLHDRISDRQSTERCRAEKERAYTMKERYQENEKLPRSVYTL